MSLLQKLWSLLSSNVFLHKEETKTVPVNSSPIKEKLINSFSVTRAFVVKVESRRLLPLTTGSVLDHGKLHLTAALNFVFESSQTKSYYEKNQTVILFENGISIRSDCEEFFIFHHLDELNEVVSWITEIEKYRIEKYPQKHKVSNTVIAKVACYPSGFVENERIQGSGLTMYGNLNLYENHAYFEIFKHSTQMLTTRLLPALNYSDARLWKNGVSFKRYFSGHESEIFFENLTLQGLSTVHEIIKPKSEN